MQTSWILLAAGVLVLGGLVFRLRRARSEATRLRERLAAASTNLEYLQKSFSRFAPEELVEEIIARGLPSGGEKREVTVLFADLVGFTALSERVEPNVLVEILNGYFNAWSRIRGRATMRCTQRSRCAPRSRGTTASSQREAFRSSRSAWASTAASAWRVWWAARASRSTRSSAAR
jgi:hypothetical protein